MIGFFVITGWLAATLWWDRSPETRPGTHWLGWFTGALLGATGLIPWFHHAPLSSLVGNNSWRPPSPEVFWLWWKNAFGVGLDYSIGAAYWRDFARLPVVFGVYTHALALLHSVLLGLGVYATYLWFPRPRGGAKGNRTELTYYLAATSLVVGLFALSGLRSEQHYLIIFFPFLYLAATAPLFRFPRLAATVILAQALMTVSFLTFIHERGGVADADYGVSYRVQPPGAHLER